VRFLLVLLVACAPVVDGPAERQRAADRDDAARLTAQLSALPGVVRAEVMLRRSIADPLAPSPPTPASASLVIIVDDRADRPATTAAARALTRAAAPEVDPTILVEVGATRPSLAKVGPFTVEAGSRTPLKAALAIALVLILALAGWIAYREKWGQT
jgi:type III secretory pathway lipoprotein EscJ